MRRPLTLLAVIAFLGAAGRDACAVAPPVLSDEDLARAPIVVVAWWDPNSIVEGHHDIAGNVMRHPEAHLELVVERAIVGDVKPGRHLSRGGRSSSKAPK